jgi:steroid delta-isomerase-like uncharacterized protein
MGEDSAAVIRKLYEAINDRDIDAIEAMVTDDFELTDMASGETFNGPEGARQNAEGWLTAFGDAQVELKNVIAAGDWAVAEGIGRGTHTGPMQTPMGEVPPTGKKAELSLCSIIRVQDGKIAEERDYYDAMAIATQLGLMPQTVAMG